jgi:ParB family chromosome partitioning protein
MDIASIPLNRLVPCRVNVSKTDALSGVEELAASIEAHGVLQNLQVRRVNGYGEYEVVAGGHRRPKTLELISTIATCNVVIASFCRLGTDSLAMSSQ